MKDGVPFETEELEAMPSDPMNVTSIRIFGHSARIRRHGSWCNESRRKADPLSDSPRRRGCRRVSAWGRSLTVYVK